MNLQKKVQVLAYAHASNQNIVHLQENPVQNLA